MFAWCGSQRHSLVEGDSRVGPTSHSAGEEEEEEEEEEEAAGVR